MTSTIHKFKTPSNSYKNIVMRYLATLQNYNKKRIKKMAEHSKNQNHLTLQLYLMISVTDMKKMKERKRKKNRRKIKHRHSNEYLKGRS